VSKGNINNVGVIYSTFKGKQYAGGIAGAQNRIFELTPVLGQKPDI